MDKTGTKYTLMHKWGSWVIEHCRPILGCDMALLRYRSRNVTDNVHPSPGCTDTGDEFGTTKGFVTGGRSDVIGTYIVILNLVSEDGLQIYERAVVPGTEFIHCPAPRTLFCKANTFFVTLLDILHRSKERTGRTECCNIQRNRIVC